VTGSKNQTLALKTNYFRADVQEKQHIYVVFCHIEPRTNSNSHDRLSRRMRQRVFELLSRELIVRHGIPVATNYFNTIVTTQPLPFTSSLTSPYGVLVPFFDEDEGPALVTPSQFTVTFSERRDYLMSAFLATIQKGRLDVLLAGNETTASNAIFSHCPRVRCYRTPDTPMTAAVVGTEKFSPLIFSGALDHRHARPSCTDSRGFSRA
jgi:hypothetical protein